MITPLLITLLLLITGCFLFILFFFYRQIQALKQDNNDLIEKNTQLNSKLQETQVKCALFEGQLKNFEDNKQQKDELTKQMQAFFKSISSDTLKEQNENNKQRMEELLKPFREQIKDCKTAIDEVNGKTKAEIKTTIEEMIKHTKDVEDSANKLANAFRGDKKRQGNWGEIQLYNILTMAGLNEGSDFEKQARYIYKNEIFIPDFIVKLPENKKFILDSKVSLEDYVRYANSDILEEKEQYMKQYIQAIKTHIKELKKYQDSFSEYLKTTQTGETLDFVCMFIPLESAYVDAVQFSRKNDASNDILTDAFNNKVAITTASSLIPVLRMISHLWNIEKSNENINDVVDKVALLHDKLSRFCDMQNKTHETLEKAVKFHEDAIKYLSTGKESVLKTADKIKGLMRNKITTTTSLFVEKNIEDDENN